MSVAQAGKRILEFFPIRGNRGMNIGDVYWSESALAGHAQSGARPAIVLQSSEVERVTYRALDSLDHTA